MTPDERGDLGEPASSIVMPWQKGTTPSEAVTARWHAVFALVVISGRRFEVRFLENAFSFALGLDWTNP